MSYKGIDYGMGQTNIDAKTGIRYGVISQHAVSPWAIDDMEADYGEPTCSKCGNAATEADDTNDIEVEDEYYCEHCERWFGSDDAYGDEALGYYIDEPDFKITMGSDGDIFVILSHFKTKAQFCSPCAPGACHLEHPMDDGEWCYCLGHDWFEDDKAPYPVYRVDTGELVPPPE